MRFKIKHIIPFFFVAGLNAQPLLTPEEAVDIALKNNYSIHVARNDADIARINNSFGNAGMLPNIAITGSDNYSLYNTESKTSSGTEKYDQRATNLSAAASLSWTLFDGGKMFVTKSKLSALEMYGELKFKENIQQTVFDVVLAYYSIVKQKQLLVSINQVINYNQDRVKILQSGYNSGLTSKTNLLQAKIDYNVCKENAINQEYAIVEAKRVLNNLLARDSDVVFEVVDSIPLNYKPEKEALMNKIMSNNSSILSFQKQLDISKLSVKEYNATRFPKVNFNAGFNIAQIDNSAGNLIMNHTYGPVLGASVTFPIFQAGNISRQVKTAKIQVMSAQNNLDNIIMQSNMQLQNAITKFENQQKLLSIEKENVQLAKENLEISMERLRQGQTTSLELRQAQQSFEESNTRLLNFQYNLKVAETKLKQLISDL